MFVAGSVSSLYHKDICEICRSLLPNRKQFVFTQKNSELTPMCAVFRSKKLQNISAQFAEKEFIILHFGFVYACGVNKTSNST
jgi:hypothetical protein